MVGRAFCPGWTSHQTPLSTQESSCSLTTCHGGSLLPWGTGAPLRAAGTGRNPLWFAYSQSSFALGQQGSPAQERSLRLLVANGTARADQQGVSDAPGGVPAESCAQKGNREVSRFVSAHQYSSGSRTGRPRTPQSLRIHLTELGTV